MAFTYTYPRPALTVDCIVFFREKETWKVLLIQRKKAPFKDYWALPGGFVDMDETLEEAAKRELYEETNVQIDRLKQFYVFDAIDRDPRHRTISVVFYAVLEKEIQPKAADDAKYAQFFDIKNMPDLAFDHAEIMKKAITDIIKKRDT